MKLPCSIIREILPNYVDGCAGDEATQMVQEHLETCEECNALYEEMNQPLTKSDKPDETIDFLKKIKKRNRARIITAIIAMLFLGVISIFAKVYLVGSVSSDIVTSDIRVADQKIEYTAYAGKPGYDIKDYTIKVNDKGQQYVEYKVAGTLFQKENMATKIVIPLKDIKDYITIGNVTVRKNGTICDERTVRIVDNRIPYIGDNSGVNNLIEIINFYKYADSSTEHRPYTIELKTDAEPYKLYIHYTDRVDSRYLAALKQDMKALLASIDNCDVMIVDDSDGEVIRISYDKKIRDYEAMQQLIHDQD